MEMRQLRSFLAVAERMHFTRAAEALHLSQPALSQQIRMLEEELGVKLLERSKRRVQLTPAGVAFRARAKAALEAAAEAVSDARMAERGEAGFISIGFVTTAAVVILPRLLDEFCTRFPRAVVELLQTDVNALPATTGELWNPRIFACLRTGDSGQAQVETVRPGTHGPTADTPSSAGFQASFTVTGRESVRGEIRLEDESLPEAPEGLPVTPDSVWVARRLGNTGKAVYRVVIVLGEP